jgi:predicted DNA-binding transcriptional regulator AlpA
MYDMYLNLQQVAERTGVSRRAIYHERRAGRFPQPVKVPGFRKPRWKTEDIDRWRRAVEPMDDPLRPTDAALALDGEDGESPKAVQCALPPLAGLRQRFGRGAPQGWAEPSEEDDSAHRECRD